VDARIRIAKDSFVLFLSQLTGRFASFISVVLVGRYLNVGGFGLLSYSFTLVYFLTLFVEFGLSPYLIRLFAGKEGPKRELLTASFFIKSFNYFIGIIIVFLWTILFNKDYLEHKYYCLILIPFFEGLYFSYTAVLSSQEQFVRQATVGLIYDITRGLLVSLAAVIWKTIDAVAVGYVLAASIMWLISFFLLTKRNLFPVKRISSTTIKKMYKGTLWFFIYAITFQIYFKINLIMLNFIRGNTEVGLYSAAYKFFEVFLFLPALLMGVLYPRFAKYESKVTVNERASEVQTYLCILGLSIVMFIFIFAKPIIKYSFGDNYMGAVVLLKILILTLGLYFFNCILPTSLNSQGYERRTIVALIVGIALNIVMNVLFIPSLGAMGASIATLIAEIIVTLFYYIFFVISFGKMSIDLRIWKTAIICLTILGTSLILNSENYLIGLSLLFCYPAIIFLTKTVSRKDLKILKQVFTNG